MQPRLLSEHVAVLVAESSTGRKLKDPRRRSLLRRALDRFERWVCTHPETEASWREWKASPRRGPLVLEGLIARFVIEDPEGKSLLRRLVPASSWSPVPRIRYHDFVVRFEGNEKDLSANLVTTPCGKPCRVEVDLSFLANDGVKVPHELDALWLQVQTRDVRRRQPVTSVWTAHSLGDRLFQALFVGDLRDAWIENLGWLRGRSDLGLHVRLGFDLKKEAHRQVAALPWECMRDESRGTILCRDPRTPISRTLSVHGSFSLPPTGRGSRLLLVTSEPKEKPPLQVRAEAAAIREIWQDIGEEAVVAKADFTALRKRLLTGRYRGVCFMGHGSFDALTQEGLLVFEQADGSALEIPSSDLVTQLAGIPLELVVLGACRSGTLSRLGGAEAFSGVAPALIRSGIPAVVAMQYPISDPAAVAFSRSLFQSLAEGRPLPTAVTEGRLAICRYRPETGEWATPVLYA